MPFDRRDFIQHSGVGALGLVLADRTWPRGGTAEARERPEPPATPVVPTQFVPARLVPPDAVTKFTETLPVLPVADLRDGGQHMITMRNGANRFHGAIGDTPTFGYDSPYLGPVIQVFKDVPVRLTFVNALTSNPLAHAVDTGAPGAERSDRSAPRTSLHLHGGRSQPRYDGHPLDWFRPGQHKTYRYGNQQEASTAWFHDHAVGTTRLNIYAGLAGSFLIRDPWDDGTRSNGPGLPSGEFELPLVLQDKSFNDDGTLAYPARTDPPEAPAPQIWVPEFFGDIAVVNGRAWPNLDVARGLYRFRVVNASQGRFWSLSLSNKAPIVQIGTDGGLLDAPVRLTNLLMGPGERADILVDFSTAAPGDRVVLRNKTPAHVHAPGSGEPSISEVMQFTVAARKGFRRPVPRRLRRRPLERLRPADAAVVRHLTMREITDGRGRTIAMTLNNLPFEGVPDRLLERPRQRTVEQWNLINLTSVAHPIHLHLVHFQLLGRQPFDTSAYNEANVVGVPFGKKVRASADPFVTGPLVRPPANERGWKDTVRATPGQITRILVPFTHIPFATDRPYATVNGRRTIRGYIWHCHILEHEENDMMQRYRVLDA